ncbi:uncharacterized protein LOC131953926 [Physella acuta]|uniref:uncharacterized protein LOC131953926 n=1 Tax=Physella acuta TaxID=109671 RepID=UPI0027DB84C2|nr:uncharacterized protein LOC131953926 [Physella acuta]
MKIQFKKKTIYLLQIYSNLGFATMNLFSRSSGNSPKVNFESDINYPPFKFHNLRKQSDTQAGNYPAWYHQRVPEDQKTQFSPKREPSKFRSPSAPSTPKLKKLSVVDRSGFVDLLQRKLSRAIMRSRQNTATIFDMNNIPQMTQMRNFMLIVCTSCFFSAPMVYMPLGSIQSEFNQNCFLFTNIKLIHLKQANDSVGDNEKISFDPANTVWGSRFYCDFTTFVPVAVAISSVMVGWSTFTIWPAMMSLNKGGTLMALYLSISVVSLCVVSVSSIMLKEGYKNTCDLLEAQDEFKGYSCKHLNNKDIKLPESQHEHNFAQNINKAMSLALMGGWCLIGFSASQVFICIYTCVIIWFYYHYVPNLEESIDLGSDLSST